MSTELLPCWLLQYVHKCLSCKCQFLYNSLWYCTWWEQGYGSIFHNITVTPELFTYLKLQVCRVDRGCRCTDTHNIANRGTVAPFHCECAKKCGILCTMLFSGFVLIKQMILPLSSPGNFLSELGIMIIWNGMWIPNKNLMMVQRQGVIYVEYEMVRSCEHYRNNIFRP